MLLRLILYALIAYLAIRLVKKLFKPSPAPRQVRSSQMVRCEVCGTFVAEARAQHVNAHAFCSQACARTGAKVQRR
jgi:formylmethanofuran dehydrogenase subunit E